MERVIQSSNTEGSDSGLNGPKAEGTGALAVDGRIVVERSFWKSREHKSKSIV